MDGIVSTFTGVALMCGIVGFRTKNNFNLLKASLSPAAKALAHRGPDDSGLFLDEHSGIGLAHRRLSIIDLSDAGHQPMKCDNEEIYIVYNGEIYNFMEIRTILEGYGFRFQSATDTEVVLKAYLQWGAECLQRFVGMFAFAIWDGRNRSLFLARDRLGIKPLYFHTSEGGQTLIFASELKAIMAFKSFNREVHSDAIPLFLHYQYIPAPGTIFKDTYKLLPGHFILATEQDIKILPYWSLPRQSSTIDSSGQSEAEQISQLDALLTTAVSDRLISDVPLGALLSGGIDSSIVVALMQKVSNRPVRTFSIGFQEKGYDEAPWAARVAKHLRTDHTELYVTSKDAFDVISGLPEFYDEPFADSSAIPSYLVSRLARRHVTVALSGDGGDEQFCGYVRYWTTATMAAAFQHIPEFLKGAAGKVLRKTPMPIAEKTYRLIQSLLPQRFHVANFPDKWQKLISLLNETEISELYRMTISLWSKEEIFHIMARALPESRFEDIFKETGNGSVLPRLLEVDQATYLPDALLTKVDRVSMANGLEIRIPLLDHRVLEYTAGLPLDLKYKNGVAKYLLKRLLQKYLPKDLFERPKMGFGAPIDLWLRHGLKELLLDYLSSDRLRKEGLFNLSFVEKRIKEHLSGKVNHQYRLWSLLMWEMWRERWLNS